MCYYPDEAAARRGLAHNLWTSTTINHPRLAAAAIPPTWWLGRHAGFVSRRFARIYTAAMAKDAMLNPYYAFRSSLWHTMVHNPLDPLLAASGDRDRLFIHGSLDAWSPLSALRDGLAPYPSSELTVLEGVGHNTVVLEPARTLAAIDGYTRRLT
jgi:pimeloyl-ACP methyl ester carboxylesterase